MNNKRFYKFIAVIYEDDKDFKTQFANLQINYSSIYILHDKDVDEETGELKKPHYHFIICLKNAKTISAISRETGINDNMIEPIKKSYPGALRYLIHFKDEFKYNYSKDEVHSLDDKLLKDFYKYVDEDVSEEDKTEEIETFIDSSSTYVSISCLGKYVRTINRWDVFRRNITYFKMILDEHNRKFINYDYRWYFKNCFNVLFFIYARRIFILLYDENLLQKE